MKRILACLVVVFLPACGDLADSIGAETTPTANGVSYSADVFPAFERRNCTQCHSGNGPGRDDGGLMLDSGSNPVHRELTEEESPNYMTTRVNLGNASASVLLTMPLGQGPGPHGVFFQSTSDPDYELFLAWILEGAQRN